MTLVTACGPADRAPTFDAVDANQVAHVGQEYVLTLRASDAEGEALTFSFSAPAPADLATRASITPLGDGTEAAFRWNAPQAADVGTVDIDFHVTDGHSSVTQTVAIAVSPPASQRPLWVAPLGAGTTLDVAHTKCLDLQVTVQDPGAARVDIAQAAPVIDGATLTKSGDFGATWHWCPSASQVDAADVYNLSLSASDGLKLLYRILLIKPSCASGSAPTVASSPADVTTQGDVTLGAQVSDDKGLKDSPTLYWSTTAPGQPVDLTKLMPVAMTLQSGSMLSGSFSVEISNPAAAGASVTLYYVVVASDNDDPSGSCDHTTQSRVYQLKVTNPGGAGNLAPCEPCTADVQCGGDADRCVPVGGASYCGKACTGDGDCPPGYGCQAATSVDGVAAKQCVPSSGSCTAVTAPACADDALEPNDTLAQATPLTVSQVYSEKSCPDGSGGTNPDWYRIDLTEDADVTIQLSGGISSDLDLQLTDDKGTALATSAGVGAAETIEQCLAAGSYYVKVYSSTSAPAANGYTLSYSGANQSCTPATCVEDSYELDDDPAAAQVVTFDASGAYVVTGRTICLYDLDWYALHLEAGQTLYVSLTFTQANPHQDLDLDVWAGDTDLTPCTTAIPCTNATGQSSDSNEYYTHTAATADDYLIAVYGYAGSTNGYDICISLTPGVCPVYP